MNKKELLLIIENELSKFETSEVNEIINFYDEIISDKVENNIPEEEAVKSLGSIDKIIKDIKLNIVLKRSNNNQSSSFKNFWIILGICSTPILLPLGIAFLAVFIALVAVLLSLNIIFGAVGISVFIAYLGESIRSLLTNQSIGQVFLQLGIGLFVGSLFLLLFIKSLRLTKLFLNAVNRRFLKIIRKITKKEDMHHV